jgi:DNA transposition AAA+ family ATPase
MRANNEDLISRLNFFVENSDLSLFRIATLIGTSSTVLSMWLAGATKPQAMDLIKIETFLGR